MRFLLIIPTLALLASCERSLRTSVPVFLVDYDRNIGRINTEGFESNPFHLVKDNEFTRTVHNVLRKSDIIIVFVENELSSEDLSRKDDKGTPYQLLQAELKANAVRYLPQVQNAYKILKSLLPAHETNTFVLSKSDINTKLKLNELYKYFYIIFRDESKDKIANMRVHDLMMRQVYEKAKQILRGSITVFYTAIKNPMPQEDFKLKPIKPVQLAEMVPTVMVASDGALFRFKGLTESTMLRKAVVNQEPSVAEETWTRKKLSTRMSYSDFELQFDFEFKQSGWILDQVKLLEEGEEVGNLMMRVGAPWGNSYICGEPIVLFNARDGSSIAIPHYQIEPFESRRRSFNRFSDSPHLLYKDNSTNPKKYHIKGKKVGKLGDEEEPAPEEPPPPEDEPAPSPDEVKPDDVPDKKPNFGPSVHCGPYFSAAILAGVFVVLICAAILTFGITMMFNCNSNNLYDDVKNKTITIPASAI